MDLWPWVIVACAAAYSLKLLGYLVPRRWMQNERMTRIAGVSSMESR